MKSNVVTVTVTAPKPEVTSNNISADKTSVAVGEPVTITGNVSFSVALPSAMTLYVDIYVNDTKTDSRTYPVSKGATSATYSFQISFTAAGTYNVYTDARL